MHRKARRLSDSVLECTHNRAFSKEEQLADFHMARKWTSFSHFHLVFLFLHPPQSPFLSVSFVVTHGDVPNITPDSGVTPLAYYRWRMI